MLRSSLCLLFTALFASAVFAQQGHTDVQSLQFEFGRGVAPAPPVIAPVCRCVPLQWHVPVRCCVPVVRPVCAPVVRPVCVPVARPVVYAPVVRPVFVPKRIHRWHHPVFVHPGFVW